MGEQARGYRMSKKIAFQMDPMDAVNIDGDSTFHLALEAQSRGHEIYYHTPDKLAFENGKVCLLYTSSEPTRPY